MSDHTTALVPIESWAYQSPEIRVSGKQIDVGVLAESLIYYDTILLNVSNQPQFAELFRWLLAENALEDFLALVQDGAIRIYEYSFASVPVMMQGKYVFLNIQDSHQQLPNSFEERFLAHPAVEAVIPNAGARLRNVFRDRVIEVKADEFGKAVDNAKADHFDPERSSLVLQHFVDHVHPLLGVGERPKVMARREGGPDTFSLHFNVDFDALGKLSGGNLGFNPGTLLSASIQANRFIWSAASRGCDLFVPSPLSCVVGDKLYEVSETSTRTRGIIQQLQASVEFPDVRRLVNDGTVSFADVLRIRRKAHRFRKWLQDESGRERDALIAYHHEVAKESGVLSLGSRALSLFGVVGAGILGGALGPLANDPLKGAVAGGTVSAMAYLLDVISRIHTEWRPVVFGNWMKDRIEALHR